MPRVAHSLFFGSFVALPLMPLKYLVLCQKLKMKALEEIKAKYGKDKPAMVEDIDLTGVQIGKFTPEIKAFLDKYHKTNIVRLNDCGLISLQNFPKWKVGAIDLSNNKLNDEALNALADQTNLTQIILNNNQISKLESIKAFKLLKNLEELDLSDNPITSLDNYRNQIFDLLPNLKVLDRADKDGNEVPESEDDSEDFQDGDLDEDDQFDDDDDDNYDDEDDQSSEKPKKKKK